MKSIHLLTPALAVLVAGIGSCGSDDTQAAASSDASGSGTASTASGPSSGSGGGGATSSSTSGSAGTAGGPAGTGGSGAVGTGGSSSGFSLVVTILLENHDYKEIVGSADAPYINSLIATYGLATNYFDCGTHPSLPNYLYMASGATQYPGFIDLGATTFPFPVAADSLGNQLETAAVPWRSYQESMGTPCKLQDSGDYAMKHDPFLYFANIQNGPNGLCAKTNVDYASFAGDLAAGTYKYMWITPNLVNDGHDPSNNPVQALKQSDAWVAAELPKILSSAAYQAGGVVFLTWDEAAGRNGNDPDQVPMIIVSDKLKSKPFQTATKFTHASYLATMEEIFGLPKLGAAAQVASLMEFFQ